MGFLVHYHPDEWHRFATRCTGRSLGAGGNSRELMVRKWASLRMQTLYRTVSGMMKHRRALELLTATEHPELGAAERAEVVDGKFRRRAG